MTLGIIYIIYHISGCFGLFFQPKTTEINRVGCFRLIRVCRCYRHIIEYVCTEINGIAD